MLSLFMSSCGFRGTHKAAAALGLNGRWLRNLKGPKEFWPVQIKFARRTADGASPFGSFAVDRAGWILANIFRALVAMERKKRAFAHSWSPAKGTI